MPALPLNIGWSHLGIRSIAQFALMSPVTFALQQVDVDQGDGSVKHYLSNGLVWEELPGAGGGGGGSAGGGSDRTAVTTQVDPVNGGYRVLTETVDGIPWTLSYDAQGRLINRVVTGGNLQATISYATNGFGVATGNVMENGACQGTIAELRAFEALALGGTVTGVSSGARFFATDVGSYTDPANVTRVPGAPMLWFDGIGLLWEKPVIYRTDFPSADWANSAAQSGALSPLTIPAGVMGKFDTALQMLKFTFNAGGVNTKTLACNLNGVAGYISVSGIGANVEDSTYRKSLRNRGVINSQDHAGQGILDTTSSTSSALVTRAIDTYATALLFEPKITYALANVADVGRVLRHAIVISSDFTAS